LTQLQEAYKKNVTIIAVTDEAADVVKPFVTSMGKKMEYTVVIDENKQTNRDWMQAAGQSGIPASFVVDGSGKIAFIGHPMELDSVLPKVASGRFDPELEKQAKPLLDQLEWSVTMRDWQAYENYVTQVIDLSPRIFADVAIKKFRVLLLNKGDVEGAIAYLRDEFSKTYADDPETLTKLAETILTDSTILKAAPEELKPAALDLAEQAAESSNQPDAMRVYAMALYQNGRAEEAIEVQKKAYFMVEPEQKEEYRRLLEQYQNRTAKRAGVGG
jgi:hypothetical protein